VGAKPRTNNEPFSHSVTFSHLSAVGKPDLCPVGSSFFFTDNESIVKTNNSPVRRSYLFSDNESVVTTDLSSVGSSFFFTDFNSDSDHRAVFPSQRHCPTYHNYVPDQPPHFHAIGVSNIFALSGSDDSSDSISVEIPYALPNFRTELVAD
jgi:hypothetical protein